MVSDIFTEDHGFDSSKVPFYVSMFRARQKLSTKKSTWPTGEFKTKDLWSCSFKQACRSSPFTSKMRQMGWIGSVIQLVAQKRPPGFLFFQLPLVPISHQSLIPLSAKPPHFLHVINDLQMVCTIHFGFDILDPSSKFFQCKFKEC